MAVRKPGKVLGQIGDSTPFDYGGGVVYQDGSGAQLWWSHGLEGEGGDVGEDGPIEVFRVALYDDLPDFLSWYDWIDWGDVARSIGVDVDELMNGIDGPLGRAGLVEAAMGYYGAREFDLEPVYYSADQLGEPW